jgi:hypothetical protein
MDASQAIISYDEKPGIQAIGTTAPDLPPLPGRSPTVMRDHEDKRHGTVTLMAGIDLVSGHLHALVKDRHAVVNSSISQYSPTALITRGGGFHPDSCRFELEAGKRLGWATGRAEALRQRPPLGG